MTCFPECSTKNVLCSISHYEPTTCMRWRKITVLPADHGLPGDECERYCRHTGDRTHCPIGVDAHGHGPVSPGTPEYVREVCWCGREGCTRYAE